MEVTKDMIKQQLQVLAYGLSGASLDSVVDKTYDILTECKDIDYTKFTAIVNVISTIYMQGTIDGMNKQ